MKSFTVFFFWFFIEKNKENGDIYAMGYHDSYKDLIENGENNHEKPVFISNIENAVSICGGYNHNFVVSSLKLFLFTFSILFCLDFIYKFRK